MAETWKWKVEAKHQSFLGHGLVQQKVFRLRNLFRSHVNGPMPVRMLNMNGMQKGVRYAEQLFSL